MYKINLKFWILLVSLFVTVYALTGVISGGLYTSAVKAQGQAGVHPENWMSTHGADYFKSPSDCQGCHGEKLDGGMTEYACNMCHLSPQHPGGWSSKHGSKYLQDRSSCASCHGKSLTGGKSKMSCTACHMSPRHPKGWRTQHGGVYYQKSNQCSSCHSYSLKGTGSKRNCNHCHASPKHPTNWMELHGGSYLSSKNSCTVCHGADLAGKGGKTACNVCHLSPKHPDEWMASHGKEAMQGLENCFSCHGQDLKGGGSKIDCEACHINPKHPDGWLSGHGKKFFTNKSDCAMCHGKRPLAPTLEPQNSNACTSCHTTRLNTRVWQPESHTSSVNISTTQTLQFRQDEFSNKEADSNHTVSFHLYERNQDITVVSQFKYNREWVGSEHNFDLFETYIRFDSLAKDHLSITLGRQSFNTAIDYFLMDGISTVISPHRIFDIALFAGIPRYIEAEDITGEIGLASGVSLMLNKVNFTEARLDFTYLKKNFDTNELNNTDKIYLGGSVSKGISIFKMYALGEYDVTDTIPMTITLGSEIYPFVKKVGFFIEGNYYNESRNDNLDTIFTIMSAGALWQAKAGMFVRTIKNLTLMQDISYQRFEILSGDSDTGFNLKTSANYEFDKIGLTTEAQYYYTQSYGGKLNGARLGLYEKFSRFIFADLMMDFVHYSKITNEQDNGINVFALLGMWITPELNLSAAFEYGNNDVLENDLRGSMFLNYNFNTRF